MFAVDRFINYGEMMSAYLIARVNVTDMDQYKNYMKLSPGIIEKFGGKFVVAVRPLHYLCLWIIALDGPLVGTQRKAAMGKALCCIPLVEA